MVGHVTFAEVRAWSSRDAVRWGSAFWDSAPNGGRCLIPDGRAMASRGLHQRPGPISICYICKS
jgi:hypothetical protein